MHELNEQSELAGYSDKHKQSKFQSTTTLYVYEILVGTCIEQCWEYIKENEDMPQWHQGMVDTVNTNKEVDIQQDKKHIQSGEHGLWNLGVTRFLWGVTNTNEFKHDVRIKLFGMDMIT